MNDFNENENKSNNGISEIIGDFFVYDASKKILFMLTLWILFGLGWSGDNRFGVFVFCSVGGRIFVMPIIQIIVSKITDILGGRKSSAPFLYIPGKIWSLFVLVVVVYITIDCLRASHSIEMLLTNIVCCSIMAFVGYFIFAGVTLLGSPPSDSNKRGTKAWKEANGVVKVNTSLMNPLYRDKYGNYYKGSGFVPVPPPVQPVDKYYRPK